jgi:sodium-coupled neutral amino acid transporter 11
VAGVSPIEYIQQRLDRVFQRDMDYHALDEPLISGTQMELQTLSTADGERVSAGDVGYAAGKASFWSACFNFVNSIVGAGIIGLAYALKQAGVYLGLIMLVAIAALTDHGARSIIVLGSKHGASSYEDLCGKAFGNLGTYTVSAMMFLMSFGAMVAYMIIIGDTLPAGSAWKLYLR